MGDEPPVKRSRFDQTESRRSRFDRRSRSPSSRKPETDRARSPFSHESFDQDSHRNSTPVQDPAAVAGSVKRWLVAILFFHGIPLADDFLFGVISGRRSQNQRAIAGENAW